MAATGRVSTGGGLPAAPPCPLGEEVLRWIIERVGTHGVHRLTCKRLALLTGGLLETVTVQRGQLTAAVARLGLSAATEPSIARRLERLRSRASPGDWSGSWTTRSWIRSGSCRR